jgi:hypothetical protein
MPSRPHALDVIRQHKVRATSSALSVVLKSSSISNGWRRSQIPEFEPVVGGRNTEEKNALKSVALSFADFVMQIRSVA